MSKTVQSVKNSLKFKASPREGILSVKIGVKKFSVPVEARMISNDGYVFLSFSASSELYKIEGGNLHALPSNSDATDAYQVLNPGRRRRRKERGAELPTELAQLLSSLPAGMRLGYGPDGKPKLVRTRVRRKKNS